MVSLICKFINTSHKFIWLYLVWQNLWVIISCKKKYSSNFSDKKVHRRPDNQSTRYQQRILIKTSYRSVQFLKLCVEIIKFFFKHALSFHPWDNLGMCSQFSFINSLHLCYPFKYWLHLFLSWLWRSQYLRWFFSCFLLIPFLYSFQIPFLPLPPLFVSIHSMLSSLPLTCALFKQSSCYWYIILATT